MRARIIGTGSYVPPRRMTNADFEKIVDTSDEWIITRTGIRERRISDNGMMSSDMAVEAAAKAIAMAECSHEEIEAIIVGTVTPDYRLPSTACVVQEKMGFPNAVAFDTVAACTGFINSLSIGRSFVESGMHKKVLVIGVEKLSSITNYADRNTCVLFGDAAGAAVLDVSNNGRGVVSTFMKSEGNLRELLWMPTGGAVNPYTSEFAYDGSDKIAMNGSEVFKVAVRQMCDAALRVVDEAGLQPSDISLVVPHQANIRIIEALAKRLGLSMDKIVLNIDKYGNTSAASVPLALDEANRAGRIKPDDNILMVAFGGGLIWGAALVRW
ncbi:MAG: ketoacyl-ACP synthase III [candidate division Zixibacteria bacterium]|nr:ketoacyl-ACP synthase III [candidate division Zixibacteria bacterium]MDH3938491.1 ketoacyl-ACP synthase III [candidate division Zixibacteria bacterium]MDH4033566.1 ketoacyl-ACP synthase III [candidate division Zixibacteria bacterium]